MKSYKKCPKTGLSVSVFLIGLLISILAVPMAQADTSTQKQKEQKMPMSNKPTLAEAQESLQSGAEKARTDPDRPLYHFLPQSRYMNDPNGPVYHKGWYHMFYQLNPFWDLGGGLSCWGHARSKDMVRWEHLPIALFPSFEKGENHCFSGSCTTDEQGRPVILYTSVHKDEYDDAEQWAATSDDEMVTWKKLAANPVMSEAIHGRDKIRHWRDPFAFKHEGRTYVVIGGSLWRGAEPHGVVLLYRATKPDLSAWEYLGVVHEYADPRNYISEVPNLFPLGNKWVLISNPMAQKCIIGQMNFKTFKFEPESEAALTWGDYNIRVAQLDPDPNRIIMWGFIQDFVAQHKEKRGWTNCMALPRVVSMRPDGALSIAPLDALKTLRGRSLAQQPEMALKADAPLALTTGGDCLEIQASLVPQDALRYGIKVRCSGDQSRFVAIQFERPVQFNKGPHLVVSGHGLACTPAKIPFDLAEGEKSADVRVYLDKSVLEVFINNRVTYTGVLELRPGETGFAPYAEGGTMTLKDYHAWEMKPIW